MIGRDVTAVLNQHENIFPDMETFYFLEPTQKEDVYELYFTNQSKTNKDKNFLILIGTLYQYETARIVMNLLNDKLKKINDKA